ncbi:MAG TPA: MarR family winged helix-turn-helix transcriptional regulator, partial [Jatrophihabitantaceae bacterium]
MVSEGAALEPGDSLGLLLWRATLRWQRAITAALRPLDLTHVQFVLLASSWWLTSVAGETPSQRRVAEHAGTDPMMTSQVLRALEAKGLIGRAPHP